MSRFIDGILNPIKHLYGGVSDVIKMVSDARKVSYIVDNVVQWKNSSNHS
jgi:hypothetical protein